MTDQDNIVALIKGLHEQQGHLGSAAQNTLDALNGVVGILRKQEERIKVLELMVTHQGREIAKLRGPDEKDLTDSAWYEEARCP